MTKIEWTDETWNPVTGCYKVSQGCKNCYAEVMHRRLMGMFPNKYSKPFLGNIELHEDELIRPLKWRNKPRRVFVNSMSDLFHGNVPFSFIYKVFAVMDVCRQYGHTFQILTKRPARMLEFMNTINSPLDNVWLGVSVEDQKTADERIPLLKHTPAAVRFLSCQPLLGPINDHLDTQKIHWVIVGGESGRNARPMYPDWVRSLRDQCRASDIPFFFKQWGEWAPSDLPMPFNSEQVFKVGKKKSGNLLDSKQHVEFPRTQQTNPLNILSPNPYTQL